MKNRLVKILSFQEFKKIVKETPKFDENGFLKNRRDWWGLLEKKFDCPVISIRPSGRKSWNEIMLIYASGYIRDGICYLYGDFETCKSLLSDIFVEADNDELEVFKLYRFPNLNSKQWMALSEWVESF